MFVPTRLSTGMQKIAPTHRAARELAPQARARCYQGAATSRFGGPPVSVAALGPGSPHNARDDKAFSRAAADQAQRT